MFEKHYKRHMMHHHKKPGRGPHHMKHHPMGHHKIHPFGPHEMHSFGHHKMHKFFHHKLHPMDHLHSFGHHGKGHHRHHHHPKHHHPHRVSSSSDEDILMEGNIQVDGNEKATDNVEQAIETNDVNCQCKLKIREQKRNNKKTQKHTRHRLPRLEPFRQRRTCGLETSEDENEMSATASDSELPRKGHLKRENINLFMWSIAEQLKSLSPQKIAQAKLKILEIVNELQLNSLEVSAATEDVTANRIEPVES